MDYIELTRDTIDLNRVMRCISSPNAGGQVMFLGTTRHYTAPSEACDCGTHFKPPSEPTSQPQSRLTEFLFYEAHESMAIKQLQLLGYEAKQRWPVLGLALVHRLGKVQPEQASVAIAVSTPHRAEAFDACRWLIERVKHDVPIWKQEHYQDASAQWIHGQTHA